MRQAVLNGPELLPTAPPRPAQSLFPQVSASFGQLAVKGSGVRVPSAPPFHLRITIDHFRRSERCASCSAARTAHSNR